ncbi:hypothetical protein WMY93_033883 [Mugilogobius chulae]|uniref:Ribonuclease 3 central domain-containing protein n=1 Tax=Mugilogobius chulae TaxID=88201 RepID=A0AAW0MJM0_9GOBI
MLFDKQSLLKPVYLEQPAAASASSVWSNHGRISVSKRAEREQNGHSLSRDGSAQNRREEGGRFRYQKLWKSYVKLRHLLANSPKVKQLDKQKLTQRESQGDTAKSTAPHSHTCLTSLIAVEGLDRPKEQHYTSTAHASLWTGSSDVIAVEKVVDDANVWRALGKKQQPWVQKGYRQEWRKSWKRLKFAW